MINRHCLETSCPTSHQCTCTLDSKDPTPETSTDMWPPMFHRLIVYFSKNVGGKGGIPTDTSLPLNSLPTESTDAHQAKHLARRPTITIMTGWPITIMNIPITRRKTSGIAENSSRPQIVTLRTCIRGGGGSIKNIIFANFVFDLAKLFKIRWNLIVLSNLPYMTSH